MLPVDSDEEPFPLVQGEFDEGYARFSPDGRWVAYISNESGRYELYLTRFPNGEGKWQLTSEGADWLIGWKGDGTEMYYLDTSTRICRVGIELGDEVAMGEPSCLFETTSFNTWASDPSGERFIVGVPEVVQAGWPITLIANWQPERAPGQTRRTKTGAAGINFCTVRDAPNATSALSGRGTLGGEEARETMSEAQIPQEDRTLAMLAHLSGLAGYIIPFGGILVPVIIWMTKKENRVIAAIAKQAIFLNVAVFVCGLAFLALFFTVILIPVSFIGWFALGLIALILPIVGAVKASDGEYYSYPVVGSRVQH